MSTDTPLQCPICGMDALRAARDSFDLIEVLQRWEQEVNVSFNVNVWEHYGDPKRRLVRLHRCGTCGYQPFLPQAAGTADFYAAITAADDKYYVPARWEFDRALHDLRVLRARRVLDIGCGSGDFLDRLCVALPGSVAVGVEFNPTIAELARAHGHRVETGPEREAIRAAGRDFDAVCSFQVVEHVTEPLALLAAAREALRRGGEAIITVPDADGPARHFSSSLTDIPPHHVSRWNASTFQHAARRLGLQIVDIAREPLPDYLWESYLPVIIERDWLSPRLARALRVRRWLPSVRTALSRAGIRRLYGIRGMALYIRMRADRFATDVASEG